MDLGSKEQNKIKVGVVTAFPPSRNSLNEFGFHLVNHLANNDGVSAVTVFADETDAGPPLQLEDTIVPVENVVSWEFNSLRTLTRLTKAIKDSDVDVVLLNLQFATFGDRRIPGGLGLLLPALLRVMGIPTGVVLHNLADNVDMQEAGFTNSKLVAKMMNWAGRILTHAILRADYVALTIPRYVEWLRESYKAENALLAPHGSFEEISEPTFGIPRDDKRRILAFGKWGTYKTVDILVDAVRRLKERGYNDLVLTIAGSDSPNAPGYLAGVADGCQDLDNIEFTGYVEEEEIPGLFQGAAVTAFPYTSTTGSSGVLHQAGSYGRSAVLPNIGDFKEVIEEEGFIGQYFEPGDASSLADALSKLLDDDALNEEHGRRNYLAATGIPMSEVVDWHLIHLNELLARRS